MIDTGCAQRWTVFAAFLNLYSKTGNPFYKACAEIFVYTRSHDSMCSLKKHFCET